MASWSWFEVPARRFVDELDLSALKVDEAYLKIASESEYTWYTLSDDCYRCPFWNEGVINGSETRVVNTRYGVTWRLYDGRTEATIDMADKESLICEVRPRSFGEFGVYGLRSSENDTSCVVETLSQPVNIYLPLLVIVLCLIGLGVLGLFSSFVWSRCRRKKEDDPNNQEPTRKRIRALDTFRGISIALMIFVNYGGGDYAMLNHATWNGLHFADVVFPWFMWIMGVCIPISVGSQIKKKINRAVILGGIIRRSFLLFLLGLALNTIGVGADLSRIRIMGVLQRFSIVYFVVASLMTLMSFNFTFNKSKQKKSNGVLSDILYILPQWIVVLAIFAAHCYLTFFFPVPHCAPGYLGPGGIQYGSKYDSCSGGAAGFVDRLVFGHNHIYQNPTANSTYHSGPFDPEGILGCLTSIVQVFLGVQAGFSLMHYGKTPTRVMFRWLSWGTALGVTGVILCQGRQDGAWLPLNKNLWSFSFVCVTSCLAFYLLTFLFYVIDHKKVWKGAPFVYPGMNATILYVGHEMTSELFPWRWKFGAMNTHLILTLESLWGTALWIIIAFWLYRKKFFLTL